MPFLAKPSFTTSRPSEVDTGTLFPPFPLGDCHENRPTPVSAPKRFPCLNFYDQSLFILPFFLHSPFQRQPRRTCWFSRAPSFLFYFFFFFLLFRSLDPSFPHDLCFSFKAWQSPFVLVVPSPSGWNFV